MSDDSNIDNLAGRLAEHVSGRERAGNAVPDDVLRAYREGRLDDARTAEVEAQLARDPLARERLVALANAPPMPAALRDKVLAAANPRPARRALPMALAAAVTGLALAVGALLFSGPGSSDWPAAIEAGLAERTFELTLGGLTDVRSGNNEAPAQTVFANLDTTLRARMASDITLGVPLHFGVFVDQGDHWLPVTGANVASTGSAADITLTPRVAGASPGHVLELIFVASGAPLPRAAVGINEVDPRWHTKRRQVQLRRP